MGDADELLFLTEGDDAMPVLKPDRARGLEARRGKARQFVEEDASVRIDPAFWHEVTARLARHLRYYYTTCECHSIETSQGWGGLRTFVASDRMSRYLAPLCVQPKR